MQVAQLEAVRMTFGEFLKKQRGRYGLHQKDIASAIDRPTSYVSRLENDQFRELPDPETMQALAKALHTTQDDLLRALGYGIEGPGAHSVDEADNPLLEYALESGHNLTPEKQRLGIRMLRALEQEDDER